MFHFPLPCFSVTVIKKEERNAFFDKKSAQSLNPADCSAHIKTNLNEMFRLVDSYGIFLKVLLVLWVIIAIQQTTSFQHLPCGQQCENLIHAVLPDQEPEDTIRSGAALNKRSLTTSVDSFR